jgi:NADH dehydrogenase ubiquinone Fe-S protein 4
MQEEPLLPGSPPPSDGRLPLAYIYQPAPSATQSALAGRQPEWVLEFEPWDRKEIEPLMGWTATRDPFTSFYRLRFPRSPERDRIRRAPWLEICRPASTGTELPDQELRR